MACKYNIFISIFWEKKALIKILVSFSTVKKIYVMHIMIHSQKNMLQRMEIEVPWLPYGGT